MTAKAAGLHYIDLNQIADLWVYRCPSCRGYHLTRQNHGKKRNVKHGMDL